MFAYLLLNMDLKALHGFVLFAGILYSMMRRVKDK